MWDFLKKQPNHDFFANFGFRLDLVANKNNFKAKETIRSSRERVEKRQKHVNKTNENVYMSIAFTFEKLTKYNEERYAKTKQTRFEKVANNESRISV